jgi:flagellar assembly protein FliH
MATIIKAANTAMQQSGTTIRPLAFRFGDIADQASDYLQEVQTKAAAIVRTARDDAKAIRKKAEQEGRQAALAAVQQVLDQQVAEQLVTLLPALRDSVEEIQNAKHACLSHWHAEIVHIATLIAARIIRRELTRQPEITLDLVREALQLATGSADITLKLNPHDHQNLGRHVEQIVTELAQLGPARVVADPTISAGGCRVETRFGSVDQQIEAQLARIEEELT